MINYEGVLAFSTPNSDMGDFPVRVISYRGAYYMIPDWSVHHDPGDEDDGHAKWVARCLREHFARTVSL